MNINLDSSVFSEKWYAQNNPDVRTAIRQGGIASALEHFVLHGAMEGRAGSDSIRYSIAAAAGKPRANIDLVHLSTTGYVLVSGWAGDESSALLFLEVSVGSDKIYVSGLEVFRTYRTDVREALGRADAEPYLNGFFALAKIDPAKAGSTVKVRLVFLGTGTTEFSPRLSLVTDESMRDFLLGMLHARQTAEGIEVETLRGLEGGFGERLVELNQAYLASPTREYIEQFGTPSERCEASIVVCLFRGPEFAFLQPSLFRKSLEGIDAEFVFINNSPETSEAVLRFARDAAFLTGIPIKVVCLSRNVGFGCANNIAAGHARGRELLIVNPDVIPRRADWLKNLLATRAQVGERTIISGRLYYDDGSVMHAGMYIEPLNLYSNLYGSTPVLRVLHANKGSLAESMGMDEARAVPAATGAFLAFNRQTFLELGGFDTSYIFGHYEDADLCLRAKDAGIRTICDPQVELVHLEGKSSVQDAHHKGASYVNRWLFTRRWLKRTLEGEFAEQAIVPFVPLQGVDSDPAATPEARGSDDGQASASSPKARRKAGARQVASQGTA